MLVTQGGFFQNRLNYFWIWEFLMISGGFSFTPVDPVNNAQKNWIN